MVGASEVKRAIKANATQSKNPRHNKKDKALAKQRQTIENKRNNAKQGNTQGQNNHHKGKRNDDIKSDSLSKQKTRTKTQRTTISLCCKRCLYEARQNMYNNTRKVVF